MTIAILFLGHSARSVIAMLNELFRHPQSRRFCSNDYYDTLILINHFASFANYNFTRIFLF